MAFINEYIPAEDKKKYNMTDHSDFYLAGTNSWTVDRERDMFLLPRTGGGPESTPGIRDWAFYWRGHMLDVRLGVIVGAVFHTNRRGADDTGLNGKGGSSATFVCRMPDTIESIAFNAYLMIIRGKKHPIEIPANCMHCKAAA